MNYNPHRVKNFTSIFEIHTDWIFRTQIHIPHRVEILQALLRSTKGGSFIPKTYIDRTITNVEKKEIEIYS